MPLECTESKFDARLRSFLRATLEPNARLRSSAEMLMRHSFFDGGVRARSNQSDWLLANPTPLSRLCLALHQDMAQLLQKKTKEMSFDDMSYGSGTDSDFGDLQYGGGGGDTDEADSFGHHPPHRRGGGGGNFDTMSTTLSLSGTGHTNNGSAGYDGTFIRRSPRSPAHEQSLYRTARTIKLGSGRS